MSRRSRLPEKPWAVKGTAGDTKNLVSSIYLEPDDLEEHERKLEAKYIRAQQRRATLRTLRNRRRRDPVVGYGIVSRVLRSVVD